MAVLPASIAEKRSQLWKEMSRQRAAYFFIAPFYVVFFLFMVLPIGFSFVLSFQEWNGIMEAQFAGFSNYASAFADEGLHNALGNTAIFTVLTVILSTAFGLALALFLNTVRFLKRFYRAVFFIPAIVSLVVVSLVWKLILNSDIGLVRELLLNSGRLVEGWFGVTAPWMHYRLRLLDNPNPIIPLLTITLVNVWAVVGFNTVIYLAGLQGIPSYLYEASRMDGANAFQNFRHITWPLLRPTTFFVVLISTIDALQVFVLPNVMKRDSDATMTVVYYLYRNAFEFYKMGYASAIAYILFAITVVMSIGLRLTLGKRAHWAVAE